LVNHLHSIWEENSLRGKNTNESFYILNFSVLNCFPFSLSINYPENSSWGEFNLLADHSNKISMFVTRKELQNKFSINLNKPTSVHLSDENLVTFHVSIWFKKGSPLNKVISTKIGQLLQGGIIQKFESERFENVTRAAKQKEEEREETPKKLTMDHLGLCFIAIMICLGLCIVVFVIEYLSQFFCR
jgi:hypothetical protein